MGDSLMQENTTGHRKKVWQYVTFKEKVVIKKNAE
jgi:hypothetical protein